MRGEEEELEEDGVSEGRNPLAFHTAGAKWPQEAFLVICPLSSDGPLFPGTSVVPLGPRRLRWLLYVRFNMLLADGGGGEWGEREGSSASSTITVGFAQCHHGIDADDPPRRGVKAAPYRKKRRRN